MYTDAELLAAIDKGIAAGTIREFDPHAGVEQLYTDTDWAADLATTIAD